jgi:hypothetical protein
MVFLGIGQFAQEFADAGRRNDISGFSIKAPCFRFHSHCCGEHTLRLQYPVEPDGSALHEPFYIWERSLELAIPLGPTNWFGLGLSSWITFGREG